MGSRQMSLTTLQKAVRKNSVIYKKLHVLGLNEFTVKILYCNIEIIRKCLAYYVLFFLKPPFNGRPLKVGPR